MKLTGINQLIKNNRSSDKLVVFIFDNNHLKHKLAISIENDFDLIYKELISSLYIFGFDKLIITGNYDYYKLFKERFINSKDYTFFKNIYGSIVIEYSSDIISSNTSITAIELTYGNVGKTIGLDIGGSDIKVACLVDSKVIYTNEFIWHPKEYDCINYHINMISSLINNALTYLDNDVDNIKISSAGVIKNNQVLLANIYKKIKNASYRNIYIDIVKNIENKLNKRINYFVFNDGDVSALFGSNYYGANNMLGLALGTSLAAGYVNENKLFNYLNEPSTIMFFKEVDLPISDFLSQDGVITLARKYNLKIEENLTKHAKLKFVQELFNKNDENARLIFQELGYLLAEFIMYLSRFIKIKNVILQGRVLSNKSGQYMYKCALEKLNDGINIYLPDDMFVRIGQAVCVANIVKK